MNKKQMRKLIKNFFDTSTKWGLWLEWQVKYRVSVYETDFCFMFEMKKGNKRICRIISFVELKYSCIPEEMIALTILEMEKSLWRLDYEQKPCL